MPLARGASGYGSVRQVKPQEQCLLPVEEMEEFFMKLKGFISALENSGFTVTDRNAVTTMWLAFQDTGNGHVPAVILDGPPGVGKTFLAEKVAEVWDAAVVFFQFYRGAGKEELLFDLDISRIVRGMSGNDIPENFRDIVSLGVLPRAAEMSHHGKVVLILDEMDKSHPSTDAFLLDFLQYSRLSIPHIGEIRPNTANLLVVITKNDERALSEPLLRRCRPVRMSFPTPEVEAEMIQKMTGCPIEMAKALVTFANKVRATEPAKMPSTPELIRLAKDIIALYQDSEAEMIGYVVRDTLYQEGEEIPPTFQIKNVSKIFAAILERSGS